MKDEFWTKTLRSPHLVVAPMVDASELAWRLLSRRHGAQLCYTPMLHSLIFSSNERYRREGLASVPEDRPLIVQFCGNDADSMLKAALLAQPYCDAIDINLGCPQAIAKRGRYGAFLQDDWPLLTKIVSTLNEYLSIPVTCKIRVYEDIRQTVEYAKMLESAGCHMLTVHGRTKEQKGPLTGLASWEHIKAVKESVSIPVLANGNIQCLQDVYRCMEVTNCDGVMSAEGNLYNPAIFESRYPPAWEMALEYLDLVEEHPCPLSYVRGHLFKIFHHILCLPDNKDVRTELANKSTIDDFRNVARTIQQRFEPFHNGSEVWINGYCDNYDLVLPPWVCKPYERPSPEEHLKKLIELQNKAKEERKDMKGVLVGETSAKRPREEIITVKDRSAKKKYKKLTKFAEKANAVRRIVVICSAEVSCPNPMGLKCEFKLCKTCCRGKCYEENADCPGHGILIKTRRERAKLFSENKKPSQPEDDFRESQITDEILIKVV
ncbi:hypothetical protein RUM44_008836 [Polyplax serrata]|uniref:tRNA-dihydrouridine(16/17) synthase [NAD(P)(+)] n=1 Tax=Polyplax serrata TaxID=468196 RepID=A0ABR1BDD5_POLSC